MWWPLRRRGGQRGGRVVFIGADGPAAPWDREDAMALHAAWEALSNLDLGSAVVDGVADPAPAQVPASPGLDAPQRPAPGPAAPPPPPPPPPPPSAHPAPVGRPTAAAEQGLVAALADMEVSVATLAADLPSSDATTRPPAPAPEVWFAFADGSQLSLTADDPAAVALRRVADRLVGAGPQA